MKLVVQIPCLNEAQTLPAALEGLPRTIPGITCIETLVIDDGSSDGTAGVARELGVHHVVRHARRRGLAHAFQTGLETSLRLGADIIVNTDADNQYPATAIADLVQPLIDGQADIVVGDRGVADIAHFSPAKKLFHRVGTRVVRALSGTDVPDAVSGFRAYSRDAALRLNVLSDYSYTLETIIQAGKLGLRLASVPVATNPPTRPSRLQRSMWHFIKAQAGTIVRMYAFYEPLRTYSYLAAPFLLAGLLLLLRFAFFYVRFFLAGESGVGRYNQSVVIGTGLLLIGVFIALFGLQADIVGKHRRLTEEMLYRLRKRELAPPEERPTAVRPTVAPDRVDDRAET